MNVTSQKKTSKSSSRKHKIWEKILRVPKETSVVRKELEELGINYQKTVKWKKNPFSYVSIEDLETLKEYLSEFPETGVETMEDLLSDDEDIQTAKSVKVK